MPKSIAAPSAGPDMHDDAARQAYRKRIGGVVPLVLDLCEMVERAAGQAPFYVQVGAHDGVIADPMYARVDGGDWGGLLFEPSAVYAAKARDAHAGRDRITVRQIGISDAPGVMDLFRVDTSVEAEYPAHVAGSASLDRSRLLGVMTRHNPDAGRHIRAEEVELQRLDTLLEEAALSGATALIVDVEGHEVAVFDSFDPRRFRPRMILFEHKHLTRDDHAALVRRVGDAGYLAFRVAQDTLCLRHDMAGDGIVGAIRAMGAILMTRQART